MVTRSIQLSLLALVSAFACEAHSAGSGRAASETYNLKGLQRRIESHAKRLEKRGEEVQAPSEAFKAVQEGMKKGNYHYDLDTARAVAREVHAHRMPAAPQWLDEARTK